MHLILPVNCKSTRGTNICDTTVTRTADLRVHFLLHSYSHSHIESLHLSTNDFSEFSTYRWIGNFLRIYHFRKLVKHAVRLKNQLPTALLLRKVQQQEQVGEHLDNTCRGLGSATFSIVFGVPAALELQIILLAFRFWSNKAKKMQ